MKLTLLLGFIFLSSVVSACRAPGANAIDTPTEPVNGGHGGQGGEAVPTSVVHEQVTIDLSGFETFTFAQKPYGDFPIPCAHLGLLEATITKGEEADFTLTADLLLSAAPGADCEPAWSVWQQGEALCTERLTLPARRLSIDEQELLRRAFGTVHMWAAAQPVPDCDEPCGYESFAWDGQEMTWEACIPGSRLVYEDAQEIKALLNNFAVATLEQAGLSVPDTLR